MKREISKLLEGLDYKSGGNLIRQSIENYVDKILLHAGIITLTESGKLCGLIAYYDNAPDKREAYLTMLAVDELFQGKGYGKLLLEFSIQALKKKGFLNYRLEVLQENYRAIDFYKSYGFVTVSQNEVSQFMIKEL